MEGNRISLLETIDLQDGRFSGTRFERGCQTMSEGFAILDRQSGMIFVGGGVTRREAELNAREALAKYLGLIND